jgi:hypothetical protein
MIPQRNLSLLANRLAKEGGRRIPESVLERDHEEFADLPENRPLPVYTLEEITTGNTLASHHVS